MKKYRYITLEAKWEEFTTRKKWRAWLDLAAKECPECAEWWSCDEVCCDCMYYDNVNVWCELVSAPASRDPVLNMLGMACCGAGLAKKPKQLSLFS